MSGEPVRVLFDNSLYRLCRSDEIAVLYPEDDDGPTVRGNGVAHVRPKPLRKNEEWKLAEIPFLRRICEHARAGRVRFAISDEIRHELWSSSESIVTANTGSELLRDLEFEDLPPPVDRSRFQHLPLREFQKKEVRLAFCQMLRNLGKADSEHLSLIVSTFDLSEFEVESLRELGRFCDLCGKLAPLDGKVIDILHVWTAERSNVPYFLTFDTKLIRYLTLTSRVPLKCFPVLPSDLCAVLDRDVEGNGA